MFNSQIPMTDMGFYRLRIVQRWWQARPEHRSVPGAEFRQIVNALLNVDLPNQPITDYLRQVIDHLPDTELALAMIQVAMEDEHNRISPDMAYSAWTGARPTD